jgi:hypothetical protein
MPAQKGELWKYFHRGEQQNTAHFKAYCLGCINVHRPKASSGGADDPVDIHSDDAVWFAEGASSSPPFSVLTSQSYSYRTL